MVTSAILIGITLYRSSEATLLQNAKTSLDFAMDQAVQDFHDNAEATRAQVLFLSHLPSVRALVEGQLDPWQEGKYKDDLASAFMALADNYPDILRVRLIGAAWNGHELVRVNSSNGESERVPDNELQEKGSYPYVNETLYAKQGDTLLFPIDLNREFQHIEVPFAPVMRCTTPLYRKDGSVFGLIVVNLNMRSVFERMESRFPEGTQFHLINSTDDFLVHPDRNKTFAFEFGQPYRLNDAYPEITADVNLSQANSAFIRVIGEGGRQLVRIAREDVGNSERTQIYTAIAFLPESLVGLGLSRHAWIVLLVIALSSAGALAGAVMSRYLVRPLTNLAHAADLVAGGESLGKLDVIGERDDEIGKLGRSFRIMAMSLEERNNVLEEKEARISAILEAVVNPIVTIGERGVIQSANAATVKLFGYSHEELVGQNVSMLMNPTDRANHDRYLHDYHVTGKASIIGKGREVDARAKDGTPIPVQLSVATVRLSDGILFTGVMTDLRERKKVDRLKNEFVSTVSHELRTPLTSIRGSLSLMKASVFGELPEQISRMVEIADSNAERLSRLINDILDIEKIEAGKLTFHMRRLDVEDFLRRTIEANTAYAQGFDVKLVLTDIPEDVKLSADPDRLAQVLGNLISNAIKFTPGGGTVTVAAHANRRTIRFEVADQGPGVPEDFKDKVFSKFAQADSSDTRRHGGTGLGLAISKAIVDAHGGGIGFESTPDVGSVFFIELPLRQLVRTRNYSVSDTRSIGMA